MAENTLFKQLCSPDVMKIGWYLAQADSRDDFVTDPIGHVDFAACLTARLQHLIEQVHNHRYRPRHLLNIDIPKSGLSVRPGNVLPIEEASLLHAIVYLLAPSLDKKLAPSVYSYRLHPEWKKRIKKRTSIFREADIEVPFLKKGTLRSLSPFDAWYELWPEFEAESRRACTEEGFTHLTKTDITAYFENINLPLLEIKLRDLIKRDESKIIRLLFSILEGWTRETSAGTSIGRGIPQGNEVSSFLGNLYLISLDDALTKFCKKCDAKWYRYVDDVKVFTRSEQDAREAVFVINDALRSIYLNLQGSKTQVLSGKELEIELDATDMEKVDEAWEAIKILDPSKTSDSKKITSELSKLRPLATRYRKGLPDCVKKMPPKGNRLFRRLLTIYGCCGRPYLKKSALAALKELPDLRILKKTLAYLTQLDYKMHEEVLDTLMKLVEEDQFPFPYQNGLVLEMLIRMHPIDSSSVASQIRKYALGRKQHWMVIQKAIEAMMTFPYQQRWAKSIAEKHLIHEHPMVRRAACALLLRSPKTHVRKRISELIYHPDHSLSHLAMYFWRISEEEAFGMEEYRRIKAGSKNDWVFTRSLPRLYAIASTKSEKVAKTLNQYLEDYPVSRSTKIKWHIEHLIKETEWATLSSATAPKSAL